MGQLLYQALPVCSLFWQVKVQRNKTKVVIADAATLELHSEEHNLVQDHSAQV